MYANEQAGRQRNLARQKGPGSGMAAESAERGNCSVGMENFI
jgi:hypothetical protein